MDFSKTANNGMILKVRTGSHLYGTTTPNSDTDFEGVFMPPREVVFGLESCKEVDLGVIDKDENGKNTKDAVDFKVREFRDFVRLAMDNNPNVLNLLFANKENIFFSEKVGDRLLAMAEVFPHQVCIGKYGAYASSQLKKMRIKPENSVNLSRALEIMSTWNKDESLAMEIRERILLDAPCLSSVIFDEGPGKHVRVGDISIGRFVKVSNAVSMIEYRIARMSHRSVMWKQHGYDLKFAANLIQLLMIGIELNTTGRIEFPLKQRGHILGIKNGEYSLEQVVSDAEILRDRLYASVSVLPKEPRRKEIIEFAMNEMEEWAGSGFRFKMKEEC